VCERGRRASFETAGKKLRVGVCVRVCVYVKL
jgi:hypothetical protein